MAVSEVPSKSLSVQLREEGNSIYKQTGENFAPVLRRSRLEKAICKYNMALQAAENDDDRVSATKNIGAASTKLAKLLQESGADPSMIKFYFKEAIENYSRSYNLADASGCKSGEWQGVLIQSFYRCMEDALESLESAEFSEKVSCYEEYVYALEIKSLRAEFSLKIGELYFHESIRCMLEKDYKKCLTCLHECYRPVEEAEKASESQQDILTDVRVLREDIKFQICNAESFQAREIGDKLYHEYFSSKKNEDASSISMIWVILDWYRKAVLLTREIDVEMEAIALSRIGRVYDKVLKMKSKAKEHFTRAVQLAFSLHPRSFATDEWYKECTQTLERYQKEKVKQQNDEWQKERQKYIDELKDELKELKDKAAVNDVEFLKFVYDKYPPKNKNHVLKKDLPDVSMGFPDYNKALKDVLRSAVIHFHPDRCDVKADGEKWKVLCEEITKMLTQKYEVLK